MVFYAAFNSISVISRRQLTLFMSSWVSSVIGWGYEVSCPRILPRKNPEDPVRLEPRIPGLRVKHFTTEPRRTPLVVLEILIVLGKDIGRAGNRNTDLPSIKTMLLTKLPGLSPCQIKERSELNHYIASPHCSVDEPLDLKTRGCRFDPRAGQLNNY